MGLKESLEEIFTAVVHTLEDHIGAPRDALVNMLDTDDWSFVIKSHALIDAAVSQMLATRLDARLSTLFERLELGDYYRGKLRFAETLEVLTPGEISFIKAVSELRNKLAHSPRYLTFTFKQHLESLDVNQRKALLKALAGDRLTSKDLKADFTDDTVKHLIAIRGTELVMKSLWRKVRAESPAPAPSILPKALEAPTKQLPEQAEPPSTAEPSND